VKKVNKYIRVKISSAFGVEKDDKMAKILESMINSEAPVYAGIVNSLVKLNSYILMCYGITIPLKLTGDVLAEVVKLRINDYKLKGEKFNNLGGTNVSKKVQ